MKLTRETKHVQLKLTQLACWLLDLYPEVEDVSLRQSGLNDLVLAATVRSGNTCIEYVLIYQEYIKGIEKKGWLDKQCQGFHRWLRQGV